MIETIYFQPTPSNLASWKIAPNEAESAYRQAGSGVVPTIRLGIKIFERLVQIRSKIG